MQNSSSHKSFDFYIQFFLILGLLLVIAVFIVTRIYLSKSWEKVAVSPPSLDLLKNDIYKVELEIEKKKTELASYQAELAKKYGDYREKVNQLNKLNLSELEKKQRILILQETYSDKLFDEVKIKINTTIKDLKELESMKCQLACKAL